MKDNNFNGKTMIIFIFVAALIMGAAAHIFEANREVANSANVISVIQDTEGNEIYRFTYSSLKEDLEKAGIDINNISEVHKYVEEKLVSCDSKSMAAKLCGNGN